MASETQPRGVMSYFAEPSWEAMCAVGAHDGERVNAQICLSISNASIVPDRPRLFVLLWKANLTHDLVQASGTMAITLLTERQLDLIEPLGIRSGRDGNKLDGLEYRLTEAGDPYFPGGTGYLDCTVRAAFDLGDCTAFMVVVNHEEQLADFEPITWKEASERADDEVMRTYQEKLEGDRARSREVMLWR